MNEYRLEASTRQNAGGSLKNGCHRHCLVWCFVPDNASIADKRKVIPEFL